MQTVVERYRRLGAVRQQRTIHRQSIGAKGDERRVR
jgi:hypothetical protein